MIIKPHQTGHCYCIDIVQSFVLMQLAQNKGLRIDIRLPSISSLGRGQFHDSEDLSSQPKQFPSRGFPEESGTGWAVHIYERNLAMNGKTPIFFWFN